MVAGSGVEEAARADPNKERRTFDPRHGGERVIAGISYGPYREGQRPGGPDPTDDQLREDLNIIAKHWNMLRVYGSRGPTEPMLRIIRDDELPIHVVVGAWIAADDPEANRAEVDAAIRLANTYPEQVAAVSVGNETQVFWSGHRSPPDLLIAHLRKVRAAIEQPVTTADDYNFWNKPESGAIAAEVDFILLHAYAMWNQQQLADSVSWTAKTVQSIEATHPDHLVVIGETGWATQINPEGSEAEHIFGKPGEAQQAKFFREFTEWAAANEQPYFYFEAFDEPWKGSDDPREVEKHWGVFHVDRTPKPAMKQTD
jgi:exo-beta-1,3-glucanase (GH17 family)